jgi:hypothetical protein
LTPPRLALVDKKPVYCASGTIHPSNPRGLAMFRKSFIAALSLTTLWLSAAAQAAEDAKYPNFKGQWERANGTSNAFDPTKPIGKGQQAPLTPEYQKVFQESLADQANGGQGNNSGHARCLAAGMPFMLAAFRPLEFIVTPETTYVLIGEYDAYRRIFTDGRKRPLEAEPTYAGYAIGKWIDEDGDGRFDVLEVETSGFKGPRNYDASGLPLHEDNESVFKERIYLDKSDPNVLHDEITVIDHALTRPWSVHKKFVRKTAPHPDWPEFICTENNSQIFIGKDNYFLSGDGYLMPTRKDQLPPDPRYFNQPRK